MNIVILAAGQGSRMHSDTPKVLHTLAGRPLLAHVLATARSLQPKRLIVVLGHGGVKLRAFDSSPDVIWVEQKQQLGTGHALMQALPALDLSFSTLVLYGDVPLITTSTLEKLLLCTNGHELGILTAIRDDASGYGRIVRKINLHVAQKNSGEILRIVEDKDATPIERAIREVNTGILVAETDALTRWLPKITPNNSKQEYYLTEVAALCVAENLPIASTQPQEIW